MASTTPVHNLPYPESTDAPFVHLDLRALALAVEQELVEHDALMYVVSASAPAHLAGRRWHKPATAGPPAVPALDYISDGSTWKLVEPLVSTQVIDTSSIANGAAILAAQDQPVLPVATRMLVEVAGAVGFSGTAVDAAVSIVTSPTAVTASQLVQVNALAGKWAGYARSGYVDVPANTATTVTLNSNSTANAYYRLLVKITRY